MNNQSRGIIAILLVLLLGGGGFLAYKNVSTGNELESVQDLLKESEKNKKELFAELEAKKGENTELNGRIDVMIGELKMKTESIDSLIRVGGISRNELARFKKMYNTLKTEKNVYLARIETLTKANEQLKDENSTLQLTVTKERGKSESLKDENSKLFGKITKGSVLETDKLMAMGVRYKRNGNETETDRSKNVEKIKICFDLLPNKVADPGNKDIYLRVIGPDGSTLYVESSGSGKLTIAGNELIYSQKKSINYSNERLSECIYFTKGSIYASGKYMVEIYTDKNKIGESSFSLK